MITEKRLLEIYQEFWQADGYDNKQERDDYQRRGKEVLKKFWTEYKATPPQEILFLEKKFSFRLGENIIKGTIDRIDKLADGTLEIIDYKTGKTKTKLIFEDKRQLILYQLFIEEFLKVKVSLLTYHYLESGEKNSFVASDKEIERLRLEVIKEIAEIKKCQFDPRPSMKCDFCDYKTICEFRQV